MFHRAPPFPTKIGLGHDFYQYQGANRTDASLAVQAVFEAGSWQGLDAGLSRTNNLAADEVGKSWAEDAFTDISNYLGTSGAHVSVVAGNLQLETDPYSEDLFIAQADTIEAGRAAASRKCIQVYQLGNEPYVGASGTHAELNAQYASRVIALGRSIKAKYPTVKLCLPALGTFRMNTLQDCKDELDSNWATFVSLFQQHRGLFDLCAANCYRADHDPVNDNTDALIVYAANALKTNAALLGCSPIITEIGLHNPDAEELAATLVAAGTDLPRIIWRVGAGDDFDLIAAGAIEVPATI